MVLYCNWYLRLGIRKNTKYQIYWDCNNTYQIITGFSVSVIEESSILRLCNVAYAIYLWISLSRHVELR